MLQLLLSCLVVLIFSPFLGQAQSTFSFVRDSALTRTPSGTLSLDEVFAVVNAHHPKLLSARLGIQNADASLQRAWGTLDPQLTSSLTAKREFDKFKQQSAEVSATIPLYWGQKIELGWKRTLGLFDQDENTSSSGEAMVGIRVPLWRNIMIDKNRASIQKAETSPEAANAELISVRNELFLKSAEKYWEWSAAYRKFQIANELLEIAQFRARAVSEEVKNGERAPIDSVEIYQEIQRRIGLKIKARRDYEKSSISLSVFLWKQDGTPAELQPDIIPPPLPSVSALTPSQYEIDRLAGLVNRPELRLNTVEKRLADVDIDFANEQWKPDISLKFAPFSSQLNLDVSNRLDYKVGFDFSMPIIQRDARGQLAQAEIKQRNVGLKRLLLEREINADIEDAGSELLAVSQQYTAARAERESADALEKAERQLFERGESSLLTVNFRERFSAEAAGREVDAMAGYHRALARYRWATAQF